MITRAIALFSVLAALGCSSQQTPPPEDPASCNDLQTAAAPHGGGIDAKTGTMQQAFLANTKEPLLIGGVPADPKDWPASVYARSGGSACSATVVGERTVKIAAHCISNGGTITFSAGSNAYSAVCTHHPSYRGNSTADWALCVTNRTVTGIPFENLGVNEKLEIGGTLRLTGYGCIRPGGGGGNDGVFRIGNATIRGLPSGMNYDTTTRGGGALCYGDSGGAAYFERADGTRVIVGTNSRGNIATESYLSSVNTAAFRDWATAWGVAKGNVRLCGMHTDAVGCRDGGAPPINRKFVVGAKAACVEGVVKPGFEAKKLEIKESVRKALEGY